MTCKAGHALETNGDIKGSRGWIASSEGIRAVALAAASFSKTEALREFDGGHLLFRAERQAALLDLQ
jgi:hypothetical protein